MTLMINDDRRFGQSNSIHNVDDSGRVGEAGCWSGNTVLLVIPRIFINQKNASAVSSTVDLADLNLSFEDAATLLSLNAKLGVDVTSDHPEHYQANAFSDYSSDYARILARSIAKDQGIGDENVVINALMTVASQQRKYREVLAAMCPEISIEKEIKPFEFLTLTHSDFTKQHFCIVVDDAQLSFICNDIGAQLRLAQEFYGTICLGRVSPRQTRDSIFTYLAQAVSKIS